MYPSVPVVATPRAVPTGVHRYSSTSLFLGYRFFRVDPHPEIEAQFKMKP